MSVKVGFVSLGCNKNLCDTENMMGILSEKDYEITPYAEDADVIVINTCAFIESAKEESINTILEMARYKEDKCKLIVCCGCLAQRYSEDIKKELPEVDVIVGTTAFTSIADVIEKGLEGRKCSLIKDKDASTEENLPRMQTTPFYTAYLKIAEGCDNHCTYCAIPNIRGKYRSRTIENIVNEAKDFALNGVKELILVAQDTTRYGIDLYGEKKLCELLEKLCEIDGIEWIRLHYCYPEEIDDRLISTMKNNEKIVKYLDMPIQHGSDSVLKRMGRKTRRKEMTELIKKLRGEMPSITIRTSIITGFPGETEEEFSELCDFLKEVRLDRVGVFAYSQEEGTAAAKMKNQIPQEVKEERRNEVMALSSEISLERNKALLGKTLNVITEGFEDNLYYGRSEGESIEIDPKIYYGSRHELNVGEFSRVVIKSCDVYDIYGEDEREEDE